MFGHLTQRSLALAVAVGVSCLGATLSAQTDKTAPFVVPVPGYVVPQAGEHPRLLFRKADLPALKKKAETEDGKKIIAQLKVLLGGGDAMPTKFCQDKPVDSVNEGALSKQPEGTFTLSHGAGFGLLYQLTGDKKYADLAKQCVDKIFEGQVDRDSRYNWTTPGTGFRTAFVLQSIALAYDLCYDAWPADYRKSVVERVQKNEWSTTKGKKYNLESLASGGGYPPGSNHYGAYIFGPAITALAFAGDPGADDARLAKVLATSEASLVKLFREGFGNMGWFAEGTSCGRIAANNGVIPMIQSLKIAGGKDYITSRPDARYTFLHLMHEIVSSGKDPQIAHRGDYGDNILYKRQLISHLGDFTQGMGAVKPEESEAVAWIYDKFVEASPKKIYNAEVYPHLAVYAFVNWPAKTRDPDEVLPHVMVDDIHGYYVARNQWQDGDDVVMTTLLKRGPSGYKSGPVRSGTMVWGFGEKLNFGGLSGKTAHYRAAADGSMELADEKGNALVVDYSKASGAPALFAVFGDVKAGSGKKAVATPLTIGDKTVTILTLSSDEQPKPVAEGATITIGKQTLTVENGHLKLGVFGK
ncbi:MAG: hypothetical protein WCJ97_06645 [Phycisphaerae bacterium]